MPLPLIGVGFWAIAGAWLTRVFMTRGGQIVVGVLGSLGLSMAVQEFGIEPILARIITATNGLPSSLIAWFAYIGIDDFMTTLLSAYVSVAALGFMKLKMNPPVGGGTGY